MAYGCLAKLATRRFGTTRPHQPTWKTCNFFSRKLALSTAHGRKAFALHTLITHDRDMKKKPKRWFQFRLRTLLALVTITAIAAAALAPVWHQYEEDRRMNEILEIQLQKELTPLQDLELLPASK